MAYKSNYPDQYGESALPMMSKGKKKGKKRKKRPGRLSLRKG
ncbi:hypothetical protein THIOSC15_140004 [uncultured Thiomicrorhabdus sp.]